MEARTIRVYWRNIETGWLNFNWDGFITADSVVHISACEVLFPEQGEPRVDRAMRHRGQARIAVENVRPHGPNPGDSITGGVEFFLSIGWGRLNVATDITVFNGPQARVLV